MSHTARPRSARSWLEVMAVILLSLVGALGQLADAGASQPKRFKTAPVSSNAPSMSVRSSCPWVSESVHRRASPDALAGQVLARMTLSQKANFIVLATYPPLENSNIGVPSLCLAPLRLTDGPDGIGNGLTGVSQLPASIGVAASFDAAIARATGVVLGQEARAKGVEVVQAPELNLARVPQSGRIFETFGEDPYLASVLGVASVEGIQSTGEMASAKHFTAYTQETARLKLNQVVSARALAELYNAPFKAVVQQGHVASIMCSYGSLNGVNTCSDPYIYATLKSWGFHGFVRSDMHAVPSVAAALRAGISLVKPASASNLVRMVHLGQLRVSALNRAIRPVLAEMFAHRMIAHPLSGSLYADSITNAHTALALRSAEGSVVLLKNAGTILPLSKRTASIAVIGTGASQHPDVSGGGSSAVIAPFVVSPLSAIRSAFGGRTAVTYSLGGPPTLDIDQVGDVDIVKGSPLRLMTPTKLVRYPGKADLPLEASPRVTPAIATASRPGKGEAWASWGFQVRARKTGTYEISMRETGDTWLYLNGSLVVGSSGVHAPADMTATIPMTKGRYYTFSAKWFQARHHVLPGFGITDVTPRINAAVNAARRANVAVIFAGDFSTEGADSPNLLLPGDENALIAAVAKVNPRTIVVLNTGGPVLMPWLHQVAGVLEAWYPGEHDGTAIAAVLTGAVDPSGRLPITFPSSLRAMPTESPRQFPGVDLSVNFGSSLDVGYRWYQAKKVRPLFAFGYGLDYTSFRLSNLRVVKAHGGALVQVTVKNTGSRSGADVVQVYVKYPSSAGEPPEQLRAFARVSLAARQSKRITLSIPPSGFRSYLNNAFTTVTGAYGIAVGQSSASLALHVSLDL